MMHMVFFVLDDPDLLDEVLESWTKAGITGATIIESTGFHRQRRTFIPMRYYPQSNQDLVEGNCILFSIVASETLVQACLQATEKVVGDLDQPNTGVFSSWPLTTVKGVPTVTG